MKTNCPNCGAPLNQAHICEYCQTIVPVERPVRSGIKMDASSITVYCDYGYEDYTELWADNQLMARIPKTELAYGVV